MVPILNSLFHCKDKSVYWRMKHLSIISMLCVLLLLSQLSFHFLCPLFLLFFSFSFILVLGTWPSVYIIYLLTCDCLSYNLSSGHYIFLRFIKKPKNINILFYINLCNSIYIYLIKLVIFNYENREASILFTSTSSYLKRWFLGVSELSSMIY